MLNKLKRLYNEIHVFGWNDSIKSIKLELKLFWRKDIVQITTMILIVAIFMTAFIDLIHESDQEALDALGLEVDLGDADFEHEGYYYFKGETFYWKMFVYAFSKQLTLYYVNGDDEVFVSYEEPIQLYEIKGGSDYEFIKRFMKFYEETY